MPLLIDQQMLNINLLSQATMIFVCLDENGFNNLKIYIILSLIPIFTSPQVPNQKVVIVYHERWFHI